MSATPSLNVPSHTSKPLEGVFSGMQPVGCLVMQFQVAPCHMLPAWGCCHGGCRPGLSATPHSMPGVQFTEKGLGSGACHIDCCSPDADACRQEVLVAHGA